MEERPETVELAISGVTDYSQVVSTLLHLCMREHPPHAALILREGPAEFKEKAMNLMDSMSFKMDYVMR